MGLKLFSRRATVKMSHQARKEAESCDKFFLFLSSEGIYLRFDSFLWQNCLMETLQLLHQGKVRDVYSYGQHLILLASDRISAFDVILPSPIPDKGKALTQLSKFWFERLPSTISHHVESFELPPELNHLDWKDRITLCKKGKVIPMECVVRGYLAGSGWKDYQKTGTVQGHPLPSNLLESNQLSEPIFTPSTKANEGHDEPLTEKEAIDLVGKELYEKLKEDSLTIYQWAHDYAKEKGILIADTKFEFGWVDDEVTLIDELLTPDSSRFWPLNDYKPGCSQDSFDKQYVRDYLLTLQDWDRTPPGPQLPENIIAETRSKYLEAYERITGFPLFDH